MTVAVNFKARILRPSSIVSCSLPGERCEPLDVLLHPGRRRGAQEKVTRTGLTGLPGCRVLQDLFEVAGVFLKGGGVVVLHKQKFVLISYWTVFLGGQPCPQL